MIKLFLFLELIKRLTLMIYRGLKAKYIVMNKIILMLVVSIHQKKGQENLNVYEINKESYHCYTVKNYPILKFKN